MIRAEAVRRQRGISKSEVARRANLNQVTVMEVLNGRRRPGPIQLVKLASGLAWTGDPEQLLEDVAE